MQLRYEYLLFDADDTILDFQAAQRQALRALLTSHNHPFSESLHLAYRNLNNAFWQSFELGKIEKRTLLDTRFTVFFQEQFNEKVDGAAYEAQYHKALNCGHEILPGAKELLIRLHTMTPRPHLAVVSNGDTETQTTRMRESGLLPYFDQCFISEQFGFPKPRIEFFTHVFASIPDFAPSRALIIGDSLSSDIQGGLNAGIHTCWYNPAHLPNKEKLPVTYEIECLEQLDAIITI